MDNMSLSLSDKKQTILWFSIFGFFFTAYFLSIKGYPLFVDEKLMYETAQHIVNDGIPYTDYHPLITKTGRYSLPYSNFGLGQSFYEIPFYLAGKALGLLGTKYEAVLINCAVYCSAPVLMSAIMLLSFLLLMDLGYSKKQSWFITLILGFCTMCWPYSKMLFRDPMQTLCLIGAVTFAVKSRKHQSQHYILFSGLFLGFGLIVKETMAFYIPFLLVYLLWEKTGTKIRDTVYFLLPCILGAIFCLGYNFYRFSDIFDFCYTASNQEYGMTTPFIEGFYGLILSSGRGFFIFNPITILICFSIPRFYRKHPKETFLFGSIILVTLLFYAKFWTWGGSWTWGPRFLLTIVPFVMIICSESIVKTGKKTPWIIIVLIVISIIVQIPGVIMHVAPYFSMIGHDVHLFPLIQENTIQIRNDLIHVDFIPEFSPIVGLYWTLKHSLSMPFKNQSELRKAMKQDCPWRTISMEWVPDYPERALGMGPDLLPVMWKKTFPETFYYILGLYFIDLLLCLFCLSRVLKYIRN